jgi:hypothetical protein
VTDEALADPGEVRAADDAPAILPPDPRQPTIYPCGCSKFKVNFGLCDVYRPFELPEGT